MHDIQHIKATYFRVYLSDVGKLSVGISVKISSHYNNRQ